jgi:hypothetical protein
MIIYLYLIQSWICFNSIVQAGEWYESQARFNSYYLNQTTCNFPNSYFPHYVAIGQTHFRNSLSCGACILAKNPRSLQYVELAIVDLCVGCSENEIVLDTNSFNSIGDTAQGMIPILWKYIPCRAQGNIIYRWIPAPDSRLYRLVVFGSAVPIKLIELRVSDFYIPLTRYTRDQFGGINIPTNSIELRITSIFDQVKTEPRLPVQLGQDFQGTIQFDKVEGINRHRIHTDQLL